MASPAAHLANDPGLVLSRPASRAASLRLDAGSLPAGVYLVRLDTERGPLAGKLVVE